MQLRPYQQQAVSAVWRWFKQNPTTGAPVVVMPTGSGKSWVIAALAKAVCERGPDRRVLILADKKELLEQNAEKILLYYPEADIGFYSAGLGLKQLDRRVTVAGVQSAYRVAEEFPPQTLVIIDECHMVNPEDEGMYRTTLFGLSKRNIGLRVVGLSATPYRTSTGVIVQNHGIFTDIAHDVPVIPLIADGHLSRLTSKVPHSQADLSNVSVQRGEYVLGQMEDAFDRPGLTSAAVTEIVQAGESRRSWLVFCVGIRHVESVLREIRKRGVDADAVTGETPPLFRQEIIGRFRAGKLKCLVNCEVLTKGFDHPGIDLIALLRATQSPGLYVQMVGRGFRPAEGKADCLVLDFGGNILRHGPVDKIAVTKRHSGDGQFEFDVETGKVKVCDSCRTAVPVDAAECPECGYVFPRRDPVRQLPDETTPSNAPILSTDPPLRHRHEVTNIEYRKHVKSSGKTPTMRVVYSTGELNGITWQDFSEWVCFEHGGYAGQKAYLWWAERRNRPDSPPPPTVDEALRRQGELKVPSHITVEKDGQYWRVVAVEYLERAKSESEELFEESGLNI